MYVYFSEYYNWVLYILHVVIVKHIHVTTDS